jgi:hypothetical protein
MLSRRISGSGFSNALHAPISPPPTQRPTDLPLACERPAALQCHGPDGTKHLKSRSNYPSYGAPDGPTLIRSICIRYERVNQSIHWTSALRVFCGTAGSGDLSDEFRVEGVEISSVA